jgi:hypothetical protein
MSPVLRSTSKLSTYSAIDVDTILVDEIGNLHLHGSTSPRAQHRSLPSSSRSTVPAMALNQPTITDYNVEKWGFVPLKPPMVISEEGYADEYDALLKGSVSDYTATASLLSRDYSRSFPKPIGTGRPVSSPQGHSPKKHQEPAYSAVHQRIIYLTKPQPSEQPDPCSTTTTATGIAASAMSLRNDFLEVIDSILNLLPTEEEMAVATRNVRIQAQEGRKCLDTRALVHHIKKAQYEHQKPRSAKPDPWSTAPTITFDELCRAARSDLLPSSDQNSVNYEMPDRSHRPTDDEIMRYIQEKINLGARRNEVQCSCVTC